MTSTVSAHSRTLAAAAKSRAQAAGYYVREGAYHNTADNCIGRWYVGHVDEDAFRPFGAGHRTQVAAWLAADEMLRLPGVV